ncbi:helix-turn-helix transcriptional regulator [Peribacillus sp. SCS-26]|uniref:helix-turn-helix transcriptional regulator n=1 Tax=Paraperibacillus marinus TaxID=3115295 RepID=UPI003905A298
MIFKCRLKVMLAERDLQHGDFANRLGISRAAMSSLVNNRTLPSFSVAYRISEELQTDIRDIWIRKEGEE